MSDVMTDAAVEPKPLIKGERLILSVLQDAEEALYGVQILDLSNGQLRSDGCYGVHTLLRRLEANGLVESCWIQPRKKSSRRMYRPTELGRRMLKAKVEDRSGLPLKKELVILEILNASNEALHGLGILAIANGDLRRDGVYKTLRRMKEKGFITSDADKFYVLTEAGRQGLKRALAANERAKCEALAMREWLANERAKRAVVDP